MIFYHIQTSTNLHYIPRLVSTLYHEDNHFYISVDRSVPSVPQEILDIAAKLDNVDIRHKNIVCWGGFSQVDVVLESLGVFLESGKYDYFINISDSDLPLWEQDTLHEYLRSATADGIRGFLISFEISPLPEFKLVTGLHGCESFVVNLEGRSDIKLVVDAELSSLFQDGNLDLFLRPELRPTISSFEHRVGKTLYLQPVTKSQAKARESIFRRSGLHMGRQWVGIHRELAEHILRSSEFAESVEILSTIFIPDEGVLQTSLHFSGFDREKLSGHNLHLWDGNPGRICNWSLRPDSEFSIINNLTRPFGRKIQFHNRDQLFEWADKLFMRERALFFEATEGKIDAT